MRLETVADSRENGDAKKNAAARDVATALPPGAGFT